MRAFILSSLLFLAVAAKKVTIPGSAVYGLCSGSNSTSAEYTVKVDSPGVTGVYLLTQTEYVKLVDASKASTAAPVEFNYYIDFSCSTGHVTSCSKSSGNSKLVNTVNCLALVNAGNNSTIDADVDASFDNKKVSAATTLHLPQALVWGSVLGASLLFVV